MSGSVRLRLGNMFDGPSDLIILPCATDGTVTPFVAQMLKNFNIPSPRKSLSLGDVDFMLFTGAENVAQFVAFAASVYRMGSTSGAIQFIGEQIGDFTVSHPSVRAIAAPLLGAGSGGVRSEAVVEALRTGFQSKAVPDATLTVNILHQVVFNRFKEEASAPPSSQRTPVRAFLSYTGTSSEHTQWVASLGTFLRKNGVEARLDQWHLRRGMDLQQWMCNELQLADRVIIISNEAYVERADGRHGGVGWETMLIQGDMSQLPAISTKYLVVVRCEDYNRGLPFYLRTKFAIHWLTPEQDSANQQVLLEELFEVDKTPPLGEQPIFLPSI